MVALLGQEVTERSESDTREKTNVKERLLYQDEQLEHISEQNHNIRQEGQSV